MRHNVCSPEIMTLEEKWGAQSFRYGISQAITKIQFGGMSRSPAKFSERLRCNVGHVTAERDD